MFVSLIDAIILTKINKGFKEENVHLSANGHVPRFCGRAIQAAFSSFLPSEFAAGSRGSESISSPDGTRVQLCVLLLGGVNAEMGGKQ